MALKYILWFSEIGQHDLAKVGGKGANLGEMARSLNVPPGFCITSEAYIRNLKQNNIHGKIMDIINGIDMKNIKTIDKASVDIYQLIVAEPLLPEIAQNITDAYNKLSNGNPNLLVAVRSSATAEDLVDASFAGQQETYLNISGIDNVLEAVQKCWASLWTTRAIHYRTNKNFDHSEVYMAVVIQEMLPADISGVMFTANPVSNSRKELLIEATRGLGEALVSGTVTGDNYIVTKEGVQIKSKIISDKNYGQLLPDEVIRDLALHGIKIERYYENYQDIEWAYYKGDLYFLQSRSITTLSDEDYEQLNRQKLTKIQIEMLEHAAERYPDPIYPIDSILVKIIYKSYFDSMEEYGYFVSDMDWSRVEKGDFPEFFIPPRIRTKLGMLLLMPFKLWYALKQDPAEEWHKERVYLLDILKKLAARDIKGLPYDILFSYVNESITQYSFFTDLRYQYFTYNRLPSDTLFLFLKFLFGDKARDIRNDLLAGIPCITTQINDLLKELAELANTYPAASSYIKNGLFENYQDDLANLSGGPEFLAAFDKFLEQYGDRETSMGLGGIASVTWEDNPAVVLGIIRGILLEDKKLAQAREEKVQSRIKNAEEILYKKLSRGLYRLIPKSLVAMFIRQSKSFDIFREDSHYDITIAMKVFKKLFIELGKRLTANGLLDNPRDIFYLTYYEIKDLIITLDHKHKKISVKGLKAKIEQRKTELIRRIARWRARHQTLEVTASNSLKGIPASTGVVTGIARIITDAGEFYKLQPGDIIVAPYTNPAWTPLFNTAAGLVVDTGGAASHAAIIAREYGIPAVMGTGSSTSWLKDGEKITINGSTGLIVKE